MGGTRLPFAITMLDSNGFVGQYTAITSGADGLPLIAYHDFDNKALKVAHCRDAACTAADFTTIDTVGAEQVASITIGRDGFGLISYYDFDGTDGDLKVAHCSNAACSAFVRTPIDTAGDVGLDSSIAIGTDGFGLISYYDASNGDLKVAHCSNTACTASTAVTIDSDNDVGQYTSIAIGTDGLGLISYQNVTAIDLRVAHCNDSACSTATPTGFATAVNDGATTSLAIGNDGLGIISYWEQTNGDLKVRHCTNVACTTTDAIANVDTGGNVGHYTSLTIGADGFALISYQDFTNLNLKVAHCLSASCATFQVTTVDATDESVGRYSSITIGADGLGIISYYDASNTNLKVVHCANAGCFPGVTRR
jgi:preprotein translocase subunit Sec61beta